MTKLTNEELQAQFDAQMNEAARALHDQGNTQPTMVEVAHKWREMFPGPKVTSLLGALGMLIQDPIVMQNKNRIRNQAKIDFRPDPLDCAKAALEQFAGVESKPKSRLVGIL
jgi:hypothetical protein